MRASAKKLYQAYQSLPYQVNLLIEGKFLSELKRRRAYIGEQRSLLEDFRKKRPELTVIEEIVDRSSQGVQRISGEMAQFWYASNALAQIKPRQIHDVGSHRPWLTGVASALPVHTLDVRRPALLALNEVFHQGRAEELPYESDTIECLTSLCSLEHFGLTSYGDEYDPDGDIKAIGEVRRVLRPGGHLVLTTLCTGRSSPFVVFNTRRVYSLSVLYEMSRGFQVKDRSFFSVRANAFIDASELHTTLGPYDWDIYLAIWQKNS